LDQTFNQSQSYTARLHAPTSPLLVLGLTFGTFVGVGIVAQQFVNPHRATILARSHVRTRARLRAVGLLAGGYRLFAVLLMAAQGQAYGIRVDTGFSLQRGGKLR